MAKFKMVYTYNFRFHDLFPMMELQQVAEEESAVGAFVPHPLMGESLIKEEKDEGGVMAEAVGKTYTLTYYNPETHKKEFLGSRTDIRIRDYVERMIEESLAMRSVYPLYGFIGTPIMKQEIVLWKLEQILAEREYGTPPPSGGGAAVVPVTAIEQKKEEIVAVERQEEIKAAVAEAVVRKEKSELRIGQEILLLGDAVEAIREGEDVEKVLERLPPLTYARYIAALRRLKLSREKIIALLARDVSFLKKVKKKLEMFTLEDLLNMVRILRGLKKESTS